MKSIFVVAIVTTAITSAVAIAAITVELMTKQDLHSVIDSKKKPSKFTSVVKIIANSLRRGRKEQLEDLNRIPLPSIKINNIVIDREYLESYSKNCNLESVEVVPPFFFQCYLFPFILNHLLLSSFLPFSLLGSVHLKNDVIQLKEILSDSKFDAHIYVDGLEAVFHGTEITIVMDIYESDTLCHKTTLTILAFHDRKSKPQRKRIEITKSAAWKDISNFDEMRTLDLSLLVSRKKLRQYVALSGDFNPIHTSVLASKAFGFKGLVAHGMLIEAMIFPEVLKQSYSLQSYPFRTVCAFLRPILVPSTVKLIGNVQDDEAAPSFEKSTVLFEVRNEKDKVAQIGYIVTGGVAAL